MRSLVLLSVLVLLLSVLSVNSSKTEQEYRLAFTKYVKHYNKHYTTTDFLSHYTTFKLNIDIIDNHNTQANRTFNMGINAFTDMTREEFSATHNGWRPAKSDTDMSERVKLQLPEGGAPASLDWRKQGVVTTVKDQGQCGSCWSFSATGSMEGAVAIAGNNLTSLSEQQLMDCDTLSESCEGGSMTSAFLYAVLNGGMCAESAYPYKGVDESCQTCTVVSKISSWTSVFYNLFDPTDDEYLMAAIQLGPVSVAVEADQDSWQKYTSGVITSATCGTALDHGVLVVGYDHDATSGLDYWIVKNSWGASWGQSGYVYLARGQNTCGINQQPSYPTI